MRIQIAVRIKITYSKVNMPTSLPLWIWHRRKNGFAWFFTHTPARAFRAISQSCNHILCLSDLLSSLLTSKHPVAPSVIYTPTFSQSAILQWRTWIHLFPHLFSYLLLSILASILPSLQVWPFMAQLEKDRDRLHRIYSLPSLFLTLGLAFCFLTQRAAPTLDEDWMRHRSITGEASSDTCNGTVLDESVPPHSCLLLSLSLSLSSYCTTSLDYVREGAISLFSIQKYDHIERRKREERRERGARGGRGRHRVNTSPPFYSPMKALV